MTLESERGCNLQPGNFYPWTLLQVLALSSEWSGMISMALKLLSLSLQTQRGEPKLASHLGGDWPIAFTPSAMLNVFSLHVPLGLIWLLLPIGSQTCRATKIKDRHKRLGVVHLSLHCTTSPVPTGPVPKKWNCLVSLTEPISQLQA